MKAISIRQPWAWAIIYGGKDVENRTWGHNYRGPVLIHASKSFDIEGYRWIHENANELRLKMPMPHYKYMEMGGVIGMAAIKNLVRSMDYSPWMFGPWGWVMEKPKPMDFFPCRGRLGLFDIDIANKPLEQTVKHGFPEN